MWKQKVDGKNERRLHVSKDRKSSRKEKLRVTNWTAAGDHTNLNYLEKWVHGKPAYTKTFLADVSIPLVQVGSWTIFCIPGF